MSITLPPKPRSETLRVELTRLPPDTRGRRWVRRIIRGCMRLLVRLCTRSVVSGLENIPVDGPALVVSNHLGDVDWLLGLAFSTRVVDTLAKIELYNIPLLGSIMDAYGVIWIHRGSPDRRAIRAALQGLAEGRLVAIAPEGRESLIGGLEEGTHGAAYLALKANAPILPVTVTGTENARVYRNLKRLRRTPITLTVGPLFRLEPQIEKRQMDIERGTQVIMRTLASMLPPEYRGVYQDKREQDHGY